MKKFTLFTVIIALLLSMTCMVLANEEAPVTEPEAYYITMTGIVKEIAQINEDRTLVMVGEEETGAVFALDHYTYIANAEEIKVGDEITGYIKANMPMIMIWPPQYTPDVIVVKTDSIETIKADYFDQDLISSDGTLKLDPQAIETIQYQDGSEFYGELTGDLRLIVSYTASTKSIPAYPMAPSVTVLFSKDTADQPQNLADVEPASMPEAPVITDPDVDSAPMPMLPAVTDMDIVVEGNVIEDIHAIVSEHGVAMLPLRAIAEKLGFTVTWEDETRTVFLDNKITFKIDEDYYTYLRMTPINLGTAPKLVVDTTYVPFEFFSKVAHMSTAEIIDGQIVISQ